MSKAWAGGSDTKWRVFRAFILRRDKFLCTIKGGRCLNVAPLQGGQVDHIVPLEMGGDKYDPANCRASCANCNKDRARAVITEEPAPRKVSRW